MSEFEMLRRLRALKVERQPRRDLWPAIAARLDEPAPWRAKATPRRLLWPWAAAATVAVAVGMGLLITREFNSLAPATTPATIADNSASDPAAIWGTNETRAMELAYEGALQSALGPAHRAAIERGRPDLGAAVNEIDQAAQEIERALASHPGAPHLLSALKRARDQRLRVARLEAELG